MFMYRYEFGYPGEESTVVEVTFNKPFLTVDQVEVLANYPHQQRRSWAQQLIHKYLTEGHAILTPRDFNTEYGREIAPVFPGGATLNISQRGHLITLIIQVYILFFYS